MPIHARVRAHLDAVRAFAVRVSLRASPSEPQRVFGLTLLLGGVCGLVAVAFHLAIRGVEALVGPLLDPARGWS